MLSLHLILIILALIFAIIATFGIPIRVNATGAALSCFFASLLV